MSSRISRIMLAPMSPKQYVQPKLVPGANYQQRMAREYATIAKFRQKMVACHYGQVVDIADSNGVGPDARLRFAGHTDPFASELRVRVGIARANYTPPEFPSGEPTDCRVAVEVVGSSSGTNTYYYNVGVSGGGASSDVPDEWVWPTLRCPVSPAEDIDVTVSVEDQCRLITASAWCLGSSSDDLYKLDITNAVRGGPIVDASREEMASGLTAKWARGATGLITWNEADGGIALAPSTTYTNAIDLSSTSVTSATPGWTLDLTRHNTVAQAEVPVILRCYVSSDGGKVRLASSVGMLLEITGINSVGWYEVAGTLPATSTKMDLQIARVGGAISMAIYAASLYEYQ
jgi:hypothetical protein